MEQQQGIVTANPAKKEAGLLTSEFWVNGGVCATMVVLVEKTLATMGSAPESAWPAAMAACAGCLSLAAVGFGYALMRTRRKESSDIGSAALAILDEEPGEVKS